MVGATGTLLTNRVVEAFLPLQALGGEALMLAITPGANKASGFLWRYCNPVEKFIGGRKVTDFGTDFARLPELHDDLRRTVYVRREKSDLGDALPALRLDHQAPRPERRAAPLRADRAGLPRRGQGREGT